MKTKTMLIGAGALAVVIAAGAAWAHGPGRGRMMRHMLNARIADAEDYIDATPQQRATIEQAKENVIKAIEAKHGNGADHQKLIGLLTADKLDTTAIYAMVDQKADSMKQLARTIVPEIQRVHDALTPAQRQKLADKAKQMHERRMEHGGFGGPEE